MNTDLLVVPRSATIIFRKAEVPSSVDLLKVTGCGWWSSCHRIDQLRGPSDPNLKSNRVSSS
jgi:hypothetical protein